MPRKKRSVAHAGYPGKDVGEPNLAEREFEIGKDEAWFAKIDRDYEQHSALDMQSARDNQRLANDVARSAVKHYARLDLIAERGLTNAVTADSERNERVNLHNMNTAENVNQQNDALFLLLAKALGEDGEVTLTISRPKKK